MGLNVKQTTIKLVWRLALCSVSQAVGRDVQGKNLALEAGPFGL